MMIAFESRLQHFTTIIHFLRSLLKQLVSAESRLQALLIELILTFLIRLKRKIFRLPGWGQIEITIQLNFPLVVYTRFFLADRVQIGEASAAEIQRFLLLLLLEGGWSNHFSLFHELIGLFVADCIQHVELLDNASCSLAAPLNYVFGSHLLDNF